MTTAEHGVQSHSANNVPKRRFYLSKNWNAVHVRSRPIRNLIKRRRRPDNDTFTQ